MEHARECYARGQNKVHGKTKIHVQIKRGCKNRWTG